MKPTTFAAALAVCLCSAGLSQESAPSPTIVVNVTVIDVDAGEARPGLSVVIDGESIVKVGPGTEIGTPPPSRVIDGTGLFLMPGLIDAHVHYVAPEAFGLLSVANGVVFVREMGSDTDTAIDLRERLRKRELFGPEMIVTGAIIDGDPPVWPFSERCKTAEDGRAAARRLAAAGVDQLKVYQRLPRDAYFAILDEAKKLGKKAVGHVPSAVTLEEAVAAGQASMEHLIGFERVVAKAAGAELTAADADPSRLWRHFEKADRVALAKVLDEVRKSGCVVCPTLVVMEAIASMSDPDLAKDPMQAYVPSWLKAYWELGRYRQMAASLKPWLAPREAFTAALHQAGVALVCGTDLANPNVVAGFSLHREMELFQRAGIPAPAVLRYATIAPARLLGVENRLGAVAAGRTASLVLLRKNPLQDVRNAAAIEGVFLRGAFYDRKKLDAMLSEARSICAGAEPPAAESKAGSSPASRPLPVLPGRLVAKGIYSLSIGALSAGTESFEITEDDTGFHLSSSREPKGGFDAPAVTTVDVGRDLAFRSATWRQETKRPVSARYALDASSLRATARREDEDLPPQTLALPPGGVVVPPGTIFDFATLRALALEAGGKRTSKVVGFGFQGWGPALVETTFERLSDGTIEIRGGREVAVSRYRTKFQTAVGEVVVDSWLGADGIPVKSVTATPLGKIVALLERP